MSELMDITEKEWEEMYSQLFAYTLYLINWRTKSGSINAKEVHDYVSEGIQSYLEAPEKFDSSKRSLQGYIQKHIIRGMMSNDLNSLERRRKAPGSFESVAKDHPSSSFDFIYIMDRETIYRELDARIEGDKVMQNIIEGICRHGLMRREICMKYEMATQTYDNGIRRLSTILENLKNEERKGIKSAML